VPRPCPNALKKPAYAPPANSLNTTRSRLTSLTEEELRQYFLYIKNVKKYARPNTTIAMCGIKFFFEQTLGKQWTTFDLIRLSA
jgi:hypothetical protein